MTSFADVALVGQDFAGLEPGSSLVLDASGSEGYPLFSFLCGVSSGAMPICGHRAARVEHRLTAGSLWLLQLISVLMRAHVRRCGEHSVIGHVPLATANAALCPWVHGHAV